MRACRKKKKKKRKYTSCQTKCSNTTAFVQLVCEIKLKMVRIELNSYCQSKDVFEMLLIWRNFDNFSSAYRIIS